jgi:hypothetical protein
LSRAIAPSRSDASLGISSDSRASREKSAFASPSSQPAKWRAHRLEGYTGTKVSGKTTSLAPSPAASAHSVATLPIVASRSKMTGSA